MLNLIPENPFRVLGVYANAKPAEIVSNCDDMEAYLSIGQSVPFDLDLNNLMPDVVRNAEAVANAKKQINLSKDKLKYALFWFVKDASSAHALNYLKNADFDNAYDVFDIEDSFATHINKAVTAILQDDDLGFAIANITEMIHDNDGLGLCDDFVRAICGDAFSISEDELAHLYIDALLDEVDADDLLQLFKEYGVSQDDDDYLSNKVTEGVIARINAEIAKVQSVDRDDSKANLLAGKTLITKTKNDIKQISVLLGSDDIRYQMIADDLAETILQCGINYFNNEDDDNYDDKIENALKLQLQACKIAVGKMCKDRCDKNLNVLKKMKAEAAYKPDLDFIGEQIQNFLKQAKTLSNAKSLVMQCYSHLTNLRSVLGDTNDLYITASSAIVNYALGMLVGVINENRRTSSLVNEAISIMNLIERLDMNKDTRIRFNNNNKTLIDIKNQIVEEENREKDYNDYRRCNTIEDYKQYLNYGKYHRYEALKRIEELRVKKENDITTGSVVVCGIIGAIIGAANGGWGGFFGGAFGGGFFIGSMVGGIINWFNKHS